MSGCNTTRNTTKGLHADTGLFHISFRFMSFSVMVVRREMDLVQLSAFPSDGVQIK